MKKKAISLLLVGAMVAAMVAGCGNASSDNNGAAGGDSSAKSESNSSAKSEAAVMDTPSQQTSGEQVHIRLTSSYMQMRKQQQLQGQKWM